MNHMHKCCICSQINGDSTNDLISILLNETEYKRRIAIENEHFAVIPSLGALVPGHSLICPKKHFKSMAQVDKTLDKSYHEILNVTIDRLKENFNTDLHFFEHGAAKNDDKLICTVDHAHLHVVPTNISIENHLFNKYEWIEIGLSLDEFRNVAGDKEYIFYESPSQKRYIANSSPNGYDSQLMRQIFAKVLNRNEAWNWRDKPEPKLADELFSTLKVEPI